MPGNSAPITISEVRGATRRSRDDRVAVEEPLEIRLGYETSSGNDLGLLVSGRASFELMQKALMAGMPILAAVSAPSSLAVDLAREFNVTLVGFLRGDNFNIYAAEERIV